MSKDSLTNSFIVKIKWVNDQLKINLQNIHTREMVELATWPELFNELISQPLTNAQQITLPQDCPEIANLEHASKEQHHSDSLSERYGEVYDEEDDRRENLIDRTKQTLF